MNVLQEIQIWSIYRPAWQRDAFRRIFVNGSLSDADVTDLADLCKSAHGLSAHRDPDPLSSKHLAIADADNTPVILTRITHHSGVNALAPEQTITFGPNLTVVYGDNGAGKSGYTRILKRACRARHVEDILGDVLSGNIPVAAKATIGFKRGGTDDSVQWTAKAPPRTELAALSVFDSHCAPVYLRDKTNVAFRPFGLDVFDKLAAACAAVRGRLEAESQSLSLSTVFSKDILDGTQAKKFVDTLTALTKDTDLVALATLSATEQQRLKELQDLQRDLQAEDPKARAKELNLKANRLEGLAQHVGNTVKTFGLASLSALGKSRVRVQTAATALETLRKAALTQDLLPGTGGERWRQMWVAASAFSTESQPGSGFPPVGTDARCPVCQQTIGTDSEKRFKHLAEFVASNAQTELQEAEKEYRTLLSAITTFHTHRADVDGALAELTTEDAALAQKVSAYLEQATSLRDAVIEASKTPGSPLTAATFEPGLDTAVQTRAGVLKARAAKLQNSASTLTSAQQAELNELRSRVALGESIDIVRGEIERKKRRSAYAQAIDDTSTNQITLKSTDLTKALITDQLKKTFQTELDRLKFHHTTVEIHPAGGAKGTLFHRLSFSNARSVKVTDVLSEGESRALSLAAFLSELSTAPTRSGIVFDDPVSSLDHKWRTRIGQRLVAEAKDRQVIVFTHDMFLLSVLLKECERVGVPCRNQYVRREGHAGVSFADLPWVAMSVNQRLGVLRNHWVAADKAYRDGHQQQYEHQASEVYGMLREAWERGVAEVLLNNVVEPFRQDIQTKRVEDLQDITKADCIAVENGMAECSKWMRGHDTARGAGEPFPEPDEVKQRLDEFEQWVKGIRQRRK